MFSAASRQKTTRPLARISPVPIQAMLSGQLPKMLTLQMIDITSATYSKGAITAASLTR